MVLGNQSLFLDRFAIYEQKKDLEFHELESKSEDMIKDCYADIKELKDL